MKSLRLIFLLFLPLYPINQGQACSCIGPKANEALRESDIVFRGKLVAHRDGAAVFQVHEQWKGKLGSYVELEWRRGDRGDCDGFWSRDLKVGNELLVFASKGADGIYRTSICLTPLPEKWNTRATLIA
jgi:hypothetical protein